MRAFFHSLKPAFLSMLWLTLLLGFIYPLLIWGIGQIAFHKQASGTLFYYKNKQVIGSKWIGQNFTAAKYFHSRPSAAGDKGYDGANSSGSNFGPTSQKLIDALRQRSAAYRSENNLLSDTPIPIDAVTASGSGLDPHIGVENAQLQVSRIASSRNLSPDTMNQLIEQYTEGRTFGLFGEKRINVLRINLALDQLSEESR